MSANPKLDLPTAPRTSVFRAMEQIVRINPIFQRIIAPDRFRTWQGESRDEKPFTYQEAPCLRWTPTQQTEQFRTPTQISGWMTIQCEMITKGYCVDDQTNLWWLLTRCFYPGD